MGIVNGAMAGTDILQDIIHLGAPNKKTRYHFHAEWTGTPAGNFQVQTCAKYSSYKQGDALPAFVEADWVNLGTTTAAGGAAGKAAFDGETGAPWVRLQYTNSASTGTLNTYSYEK